MDTRRFSPAGLNADRNTKRKPVRPHTEGRTRNTHAVWPVTDASDHPGDETDTPMDLEELGEQVGDTTGTGRFLAAPRTTTRAEREEHDVSHVPYRPWCRFGSTTKCLDFSERRDGKKDPLWQRL